MATNDAVDEYFSGQGVVLLSERDTDGTPLGFTSIGNVSSLALSIATATLEHKESHTGQRGVDLRLVTETTASLSMVMENFIAANLATVLRGSTASVAGAAVTTEIVKWHPNLIMPLLRMKITAGSVTVTTTEGTPVVLVEDTDYLVNYDQGSLRFVATASAIADGDNLEVDYTFETQEVVQALDQGQKDFIMRFEGLNTAKGNEPVLVEVFKFSADPLQELSMIGDDIAQFTLEGSVLADSLKTVGSQFFKITKI